jgi:hypothetical protein
MAGHMMQELIAREAQDMIISFRKQVYSLYSPYRSFVGMGVDLSEKVLVIIPVGPDTRDDTAY